MDTHNTVVLENQEGLVNREKVLMSVRLQYSIVDFIIRSRHRRIDQHKGYR